MDRTVRDRARRALAGLIDSERRSNLDIRPLTGRSPWLRMRVGDFRVIFRELTPDEVRSRGIDPPGYLVDRVVNRKDLEEAIRPL
jgi:hypothetical protein